MSLNIKWIGMLFLSLLLSISHAQIIVNESENAVDQNILANPYQTIYTHLFYLQDESYKPSKSAACIYGDYSSKEKEEYAIKIKKVLDGKAIFIDMNILPQDSVYIDSASNRHIYYLSAKEKLIYLEKINGAWCYSRTTIANIDMLYKKVYPSWAGWIDCVFSSKFGTKKILGLRSWQWVAILFLNFVLLLVYFVLKKLFVLIITRLVSPLFSKELSPQKMRNRLGKAFALMLIFGFLSGVLPSLRLPLKFSLGLILITKILFICFASLFASNVFKLIIFYLKKAAEKTNTKLDNQVLPILSKIGKILIYTIGIIYILQALNINIMAMLAGLSIGGLALALASKDTVQNIIGSINIFLDRPFEIDDYIKVDGIEGTVEEVGIRATRIRTKDQSLAYIPNGVLSNLTIDNYGLRIYRRWISSLGIDYDTAPEKIKLFVEGVYKIIEKNEYTLEEKCIVKFNNMGASSLDIYMSVFINVKSYEADLNCRQSILLDVLNLAKKMEIEFAFPSQTIYYKKSALT